MITVFDRFGGFSRRISHHGRDKAEIVPQNRTVFVKAFIGCSSRIDIRGTIPVCMDLLFVVKPLIEGKYCILQWFPGFMVVLSQADIIGGGPVFLMTVNLKSHASALPGSARNCSARSCIVTKLGNIDFHKRQALVRRQRRGAIVHLAVCPGTAAAAPDLQTLFIHFFRRRKRSAAGSIPCSADIEHQIQCPAASGISQPDLGICLLAYPAARHLRGKRTFCTRGRKFKRDTADKFCIRPGRIQCQNIFPGAFCALHRGQLQRISRLGMSLQHRRDTTARCTGISGFCSIFFCLHAFLLHRQKTGRQISFFRLRICTCTARRASQQARQLQIHFFFFQHCFQPRVFSADGRRMDQKFQICLCDQV